MAIYQVADYWKETDTYYCLYYKDEQLFFAEFKSEEIKLPEHKETNPFKKFIKDIINQMRKD